MKMATGGVKRKCDEILNDPRKIAATDQLLRMDIKPTAINSTTIIDLNDDCLREICEYLDEFDLGAFADSCNRFRKIAQMHFAGSKMRHDTHELCKNVKSLRFWRNFGASMSTVIVSYSKKNNEFLIETLMQYCGQSVRALTLKYLHIDVKIGQKLAPLLMIVHKLGIIECRCTYSFFKTLSMCLLELREFELKTETPKDCDFIRNWPKLELFSMGYLANNQFETLLQQNPQLKTIQLNGNGDSVKCMALIAEHLSSVESLSITGEKMIRSDSICKLNSLKKLVIKSCLGSIDSDINRMATANVPIEILEISDCPCNNDLLKAISKLKNLKKLLMKDVTRDLPSDIFILCETLGKLTELDLEFNGILFDDDLLRILQSAKKLKKLCFRRHCSHFNAFGGLYLCIDADTYTKIAEIVRWRSEIDTQHLEIVFEDRFYTMDVPSTLRNAYGHLLKIEINKC